ncbi:putative zinc-binding metallopeptidase [Pinisolibacter aquiterrae]|uniref:putative zinc-binding metallopeptidase n=1 Tax=Pinisolibacter aquiterrae TaxID=2815579 RepID=UPI003B75C6AE
MLRDCGRLDDFRALFGDERADYGEVLRRHYDEGPLPDWRCATSTPMPRPALGRISRRPGRI